MSVRGLATNNTVDMETEPPEIQFENGSNHAVVASYSELYEEGEVKISTVPPTLPVSVGVCVLEESWAATAKQGVHP